MVKPAGQKVKWLTVNLTAIGNGTDQMEPLNVQGISTKEKWLASGQPMIKKGKCTKLLTKVHDLYAETYAFCPQLQEVFLICFAIMIT